MLGRLRHTFAEIDLKVLEQNFTFLKDTLGGQAQKLLPMVKADAYGHGDVQVARVCEALGARGLGVVLIEEGVKLRLAGIQSQILVFSHFDAMGAEAIVKYRLTPVLSLFEQIQKLRSALHDQALYGVHVKFNTGMQRLGFEPEQAQKILKEIESDSYLKLEGICTHFVSSEDFFDSHSVTKEQIKTFDQILNVFKNHKFLSHSFNSGAILTGVEPKYDFARPGIALYGASPLKTNSLSPQISPVLQVKSFVGFMHKVKKGAKVSYGGTWQAPKDSTIAVIPIGYADGYPRALSNKGIVLIRGVRCPIVGIVCMDYIMVDVSSLVEKNLGPTLGDEVVLIGKQKNEQILSEELAKLATTIPYEILTGIQNRMPRIYIH